MLDKIARELEKYKYAEAMLSNGRYNSISLKDGEVDAVKEGETQNIAFRVYENGFFGFAVSNTFENFEGLLKKAGKMAKAGAGKATIGRAEVNEGKVEVKPKKDPAGYALEDKIGMLKEFESAARAEKIHSTNLVYSDSSTENSFLSSLGAKTVEKEARVHAGLFAYAKAGNRLESAYDQVKERAGLEALAGFEKKAVSAAQEAKLLLGAGAAPKGRMTCVLDPELAGVMAHEAMGHACEADGIQINDSVLRGKLGKKLGSEAFAIRDSPVLPARMWGSYAFDDEGTRSKGTTLFEGGVLKAYITSLESAGQLGGKLTGNARSDFSGMQIVRMSNTYFEKGSAQTEELFEGVREGVYLVGCKEGQVSPKTGNFTFAAKYGYTIKDGDKERLVKNCSINGNILSSLHGIDLVASDLDFSPGTCGKDGQEAPVTTGSPHLRINGIVVG